MSVISKIAKWYFRISDEKRDQDLKKSNEIIGHYNIIYGKNKRWNQLDIYRPSNLNGPLPTIISVHGGAWIYGDKEAYKYYCMELAKMGFTVVNFSYRLAPTYKFPSALEDLNEVMHWVMEHYSFYHIDADGIFMVGDSAGAHLASLYACICTNPIYRRRYTFTIPKNFVPKALALNCGIYHIEKAYKRGSFVTRTIIRDMMGSKDIEKKLPWLSTNYFITPDFPPTYLMTASGDFLKYQSIELKSILKQNLVTHRYRLFGGKENLLPHVFHCDICKEDSVICNREECEFFMQIYNKIKNN